MIDVSIGTHNVGEGKIAITAQGQEMTRIPSQNYRTMQDWLRGKQHAYATLAITFNFQASGSNEPEDQKEMEDAEKAIDSHLKMIGGGTVATPTQAASTPGGSATAAPPGTAVQQATSPGGVATLPPPSPAGAPNQAPINRSPAAPGPPAKGSKKTKVVLSSAGFFRRLGYLFTNK